VFVVYALPVDFMKKIWLRNFVSTGSQNQESNFEVILFDWNVIRYIDILLLKMLELL
jgi:hypothetical protein